GAGAAVGADERRHDRGRRSRRRGRIRRGRQRRMTDEPQEQVEQVEEPQPDVVDDRLLRLAADFENYKKRAARERAEYVARANERLLKELLPILDDLERALNSAEEHEEAQLEEG